MAYGSYYAVDSQLVVFILRISAFFADVESTEVDQSKTDFSAARLFNNIFLGSFVYSFFGHGIGIGYMKNGKIMKRKREEKMMLNLFTFFLISNIVRQ